MRVTYTIRVEPTAGDSFKQFNETYRGYRAEVEELVTSGKLGPPANVDVRWVVDTHYWLTHPLGIPGDEDESA